VNPVRVADDQALGRLAENLGQPGGGYAAAVDQVAQDIARADRGQLVRVADQQQAVARFDRLQQAAQQKHVDHGGFVDHNQVGRQLFAGLGPVSQSLVAIV